MYDTRFGAPIVILAPAHPGFLALTSFVTMNGFPFQKRRS